MSFYDQPETRNFAVSRLRDIATRCTTGPNSPGAHSVILKIHFRLPSIGYELDEVCHFLAGLVDYSLQTHLAQFFRESPTEDDGVYWAGVDFYFIRAGLPYPSDPESSRECQELGVVLLDLVASTLSDCRIDDAYLVDVQQSFRFEIEPLGGSIDAELSRRKADHFDEDPDLAAIWGDPEDTEDE